ncbi:39S ribosomal protein L33, mitochondrial [Polyrhizophydium stewartii]|uniref:Large ribosomal subunit protein uL30m n=1 Tax=Polyrhizophydium stewartii TaxID=2732419 RepID=A0ABR4N1I2_9FUNG
MLSATTLAARLAASTAAAARAAFGATAAAAAAGSAWSLVRTRPLSTSAPAAYPRVPRRTAPDTKPKFPRPSMLKLGPAPKPVYHFFPPRKDRPRQPMVKAPPKAKRYLSDVETSRPLPTTFAKGESEKDFKTRPSRIGEPLPKDSHMYPYRFYEITMRRGLFGIPRATRKVMASLGLTKRHQVVWCRVDPRSAGKILKVKELVHVRLTNTIPEKAPLPLGYKRVGSLVGQPL